MKIKFLTIPGLMGIIACLGFLLPSSPYNEKEEIDELFGHQLTALLTEMELFEMMCDEKATRRILKKHFKSARLAYKKVAVLIEYFHPSETILLNGAALPRAEIDNPNMILSPHGFQVIEEQIFGDWNKESYSLIKTEINEIITIIKKFMGQPNRAYKFKKESVVDAMRLAMIRLTALGISGFDSPVAAYSIPEAAATLESIQKIISIYRLGHPFSFDSIGISDRLFSDAIHYLESNKNFNRFDRLYFIRNHVLPSYSIIIKLSNEPGYILPRERNPLSAGTENFLSASAFDISFFSPSDRFGVTPERVQLGKQLFFDPILSQTRNRSCASCHKPELAFTDGLKTALAVDQKSYLLRNTPTLWNSVYQTKQFFDSRTSMLEHQLNAVIHDQQEMKGSLSESAKELNSNKQYAELFRKAYPGEEETVTQYSIANAISSYVRSLVAMNSRFDLYIQGDESVLTKEEKKGFNLFMGKAKCGTCHFIPLFNGLVPPEFTETESEVLGVPKSKDVLSPVLDSDEGKFRFTRSAVHKYAFKTPTLRNIELTAPYMHNGVYNTLEEVMDFYNKGGGTGLKIAPEIQTLPEEKLNLSKKEIRAVIAFMKTLTDSAVLNYR